MFLHNLKIAFRNILKYKTQSVISILGLAIGFTAFAFTMSWIRYEMSYDSHNPDADRIYCVISNDNQVYNNQTSLGLTEYLKKNFPEVESACNAYSSQIIIPDELVKSMWDKFVQDCRFSVLTDTAFFSVFYPDEKIKFPHPLPKNATVFPHNIAEKWNITSDKFGQNIDSLDLTPIAIVKDRPLPSNVAFGWMSISNPSDANVTSLWNSYSGYTYIRLHKGASIENIRKKISKLEISIDGKNEIHSHKIYPLRKAHFLIPNEDANIKFEALKQFAIVALLVIICALTNYIMLFISRVRIRSREFALNKVNGASNMAILRLLLNEFMLILIAAIFIGGVLTELLFTAFSRFSMIIAPKSYFLVSLFWYSLIIILTTTLATFIPVYGFVRRNIRENIAPENKLYRSLKINFSHISIFIQLCIGVLLIFSTAIVFSQYLLMDQRVGYNRNRLMVYGTNNTNIPVSEVKKIPGIGDFIVNLRNVFFWSRAQFLQELEITDNEQNIEKHRLDIIHVDSGFRHFLEIPLLEGRDLLPSEQSAYFINETGNRELGNNAVGKIVNGCPIIGVIHDLQVESALVKIVPTLYGISNTDNEPQMCSNITLRCKDDITKKRVNDWFIQKFPPTTVDGESYRIFNFYSMDIDKNFREFTKSERNLLFLIGVMTAVAILIAIFGIYSMITLSCTQRRKEIAIRKVNGAKMKEILALFIRHYFIVLFFACIVAFPIGIYVMLRWLEQYTRRISMEWWIFAGIVLLVGLIVFASIFLRVYRAAKENPAEVVKSE